MAPKRFGKYEVLARLATGGAANIFLARQPGVAGFHKLVCLKTLLPERASDADFVAMFLDEARLAARLNHPNCVQIYDLGRVRGSYYISMEYIFGETLWNLLATVTKLRTGLPAPHVASIIASVCDGLHHAHELKDSNGRPYNLVHRDVSPQNIMITFEGQTKVVDFGIAKAETGRIPTVAGIVKGKFSYMSPEQITGGSIDRRSDIYSLGIVFFECLASRRLYRGDSPEDIARLILEHRAPRLRDVVPEVPAALDAICATALSRHPSKRYQSALEMGDALRDYLDGIRYAHSAGSIARLVEERFAGQIPARRKVFETALAGSHDEKHLLEVLDARPARDIDLFPEEEQAKVDGDFVEGQDAAEVAAVLSHGTGGSAQEVEVERSTEAEETGDFDRRDREPRAEPALREAPGWRVELEPSSGDQAEVSALTEWQGDAPFDDRTRVDGEDVMGPDGVLVPDDSALSASDFSDETELPGRPPIDLPTNVEPEIARAFVDPAAVAEALKSRLPSMALAPSEAQFTADATIRNDREDKTFLDPTDQLDVETSPLAAAEDQELARLVSESLRAKSMGSAARLGPEPRSPSMSAGTAPLVIWAGGQSGVRRPITVLRGTSGVAQGAKSSLAGAHPVWSSGPTSPAAKDGTGPTNIEAAALGARDTVLDALAMPADTTALEHSTLTASPAIQEALGAIGGLEASSLPRAVSSTEPSFAQAQVDAVSLIRRATSEMMPRDTALDATNGVQFTPAPGAVGASATAPLVARREEAPDRAREGAASDGRFGIGTVLSALGFGIAVGIVIGLLIARAAYAPTEVVPPHGHGDNTQP